MNGNPIRNYIRAIRWFLFKQRIKNEMLAVYSYIADRMRIAGILLSIMLKGNSPHRSIQIYKRHLSKKRGKKQYMAKMALKNIEREVESLCTEGNMSREAAWDWVNSHPKRYHIGR